MARIRSVKPEYWIDPNLTRLSRDARLLYIALWNFADEHGRLHGDPRVVKGQCFPYDDDLTPAIIDALIDDLIAAKKAKRYEIDGATYLELPNLKKHQRLEPEKVPSRLPEPSPEHEIAVRAHSSESRADESARREDELSLMQVAGSRLQVAGNHSSTPADAGGEFNTFWTLYPRKVKKPEAVKAWAKATRTTDASTIIDGLKRYLPVWERKDRQFVPHAATWLRAEQWTDELEADEPDDYEPAYRRNNVTGMGRPR